MPPHRKLGPLLAFPRVCQWETSMITHSVVTITMGKVSTDKSAQNFSYYLSLLSTYGTDIFWCPNSYSTKKIAISTAEPFGLTISTNLSHSAYPCHAALTTPPPQCSARWHTTNLSDLFGCICCAGHIRDWVLNVDYILSSLWPFNLSGAHQDVILGFNHCPMMSSMPTRPDNCLDINHAHGRLDG